VTLDEAEKRRVTMERYMVISADAHAGVPDGGYRQYMERRHWRDYDEYLAGYEPGLRGHRLSFNNLGGEIFREEVTHEMDSQREVQAGGRSGAYDAARRLREMEADGIVADVLFPDGSLKNAAPFFASAKPGTWRQELQGVGARAYNRWLADFCSQNPGRHAGLAVITIHDIEGAVAEIRWAKDTGLRGVIIPASVGEGGLPFYNHPRYEPLWATCAETGLPIHTHVGSSMPEYGGLPGARYLFPTESAWLSHRPLWFLLWSGVFHRYPTLKMVFTEQGCTWVPDALQRMDRIYKDLFREARHTLPLSPTECWERQCFVSAMLRDPTERDARHHIGVNKIVWGSDYPHFEGSWPHSVRTLHNALNGVPEPDVRAMLGENAAQVYGFDVAKLRPVAERVGPRVSDI
jgi:predicted TIM-barrel fold metal-dependent hydrolase